MSKYVNRSATHLATLGCRYRFSICTFRPPVTLDARYGICELPQERSDEDGRANSISASPLAAAWLRLDIPAKAPITQLYQSFRAVLLSGASVNLFTLAFLIKSAETLRAQPIPLFFVRLLVDPNWHRGASLTTLACAWLRLDVDIVIRAS